MTGTKCTDRMHLLGKELFHCLQPNFENCPCDGYAICRWHCPAMSKLFVLLILISPDRIEGSSNNPWPNQLKYRSWSRTFVGLSLLYTRNFNPTRHFSISSSIAMFAQEKQFSPLFPKQITNCSNFIDWISEVFGAELIAQYNVVNLLRCSSL